jgi:hypothetical protein
MYLAPQRRLVYLYAYLEDPTVLESLQRDLRTDGAELRMIYAYEQPGQDRFLAVLAIDTTNVVDSGSSEIPLRPSAIPGF